jgi:hypothetical protein
VGLHWEAHTLQHRLLHALHPVAVESTHNTGSSVHRIQSLWEAHTTRHIASHPVASSCRTCCASSPSTALKDRLHTPMRSSSLNRS